MAEFVSTLLIAFACFELEEVAYSSIGPV